MRRTGVRILSPILFVLAAVAGAQASDDAAETRAVLVDMWDALEKGDLERYAANVHPDFKARSTSAYWT